MLLRNLSELPALLKKNECLLGLDYGSVVIGVAISDPGLHVASPIGSIVRTKFVRDQRALLELMNDRMIGGLVLGMPKNMDSSEGASAQAARAFARNLARPLPTGETNPFATLPVAFWDERLSTAAVERFLIAEDMSRKRRNEVVDKAAAAYILQGALDALRLERNRNDQGNT